MYAAVLLSSSFDLSRGFGWPSWFSNEVRLIVMMVMLFVFAVAEITVGFIVNSLALQTDAFHMLSDMIALVVAFIAMRLSKRRRTRFMSYGWIRAEVIGGLVNGVFLLTVCLFIVLEAIERFFRLPVITNPRLIIIMGASALGMNLIGLLMFAGHSGIGHGHAHAAPPPTKRTVAKAGEKDEAAPTGVALEVVTDEDLSEAEAGEAHTDEESSDEHHSHHAHHDKREEKDEKKCDKKEKKKGHGHGHAHGKSHAEEPTNLNLRGVFLHLLGDALGAIAVIVVGLCVLYIRPHWKYYLDPTLSVSILVQRVPEVVDLEQVEKDLRKVPGVTAVHELHIWELSPTKYIGTLHAQCSKSAHFMSIAAQMKEELHRHGVHATTIQPEFLDEPSETIRQEHKENDCLLACPKPGCEKNVCCERPARTGAAAEHD